MAEHCRRAGERSHGFPTARDFAWCGGQPPARPAGADQRRPGREPQLTAITGVILIVLLAVIGLTILRIRQLISVHLFVGLLLIGPVALKMASTGYRFMRYYSGNRVYREKGPPETWLRLLAPGVVLSTVIVFVTGVLLMFAGPAHRNPLLELHKVGFIVWVVLTALHVLGHLPTVARLFGIHLNAGVGAGGQDRTRQHLGLRGPLDRVGRRARRRAGLGGRADPGLPLLDLAELVPASRRLIPGHPQAGAYSSAGVLDRA